MPRLSLTNTIPVILVIGTIVLFVHKWSMGPPEPEAPPSTASVSAPSQSESGLREGSGAIPPPAAAPMNPTPAGTSAPPNPGNAPSSATPQAPSGEPARPIPGR